MSSAVDTARADVESAVSAAWASQTSIQWTGRPFAEPSGPWLRVTVLFGEAFPMTMSGTAGLASNRIRGIVDGSIFAKKGAGLGTIVSYADDFRIALNQQLHGTVRFGVCSGPVEVTVREKGTKHRAHLSVSAPFEIYEAV